MYFYFLKLLLRPDDAVKIPGLAYPTEELHQRKPDVERALETLDRFPSRIDPIKVNSSFFLMLYRFIFKMKFLFF